MRGNLKCKLGAQGTEPWVSRESRWGKKKHPKNIENKILFRNEKILRFDKRTSLIFPKKAENSTVSVVILHPVIGRKVN